MKIRKLIATFEDERPKDSLNCLGWKIAGKSEYLVTKFTIPDIIKERSMSHDIIPPKRDAEGRENEKSRRIRKLLRDSGMDACKNIGKMLLFSQADAQTGFHMDFSGSDVFYLMLCGSKDFYLVPATPENITAFRDFESNKNAAELVKNNFFPVLYDIPFTTVQLNAGDLIFMPSQVIHYVDTKCDSVVFAGNYLSKYSINRIVDEWSYEKDQEVGDDEIFPNFEFVMYGYLFARLKEASKSLSLISTTEMKPLYNLFTALQKYSEQDIIPILTEYLEIVVSLAQPFVFNIV